MIDDWGLWFWDLVLNAGKLFLALVVFLMLLYIVVLGIAVVLDQIISKPLIALYELIFKKKERRDHD